MQLRGVRVFLWHGRPVFACPERVPGGVRVDGARAARSAGPRPVACGGRAHAAGALEPARKLVTDPLVGSHARRHEVSSAHRQLRLPVCGMFGWPQRTLSAAIALPKRLARQEAEECANSRTSGMAGDAVSRQAQRGCRAHRSTRNATPRVAPPAIGLTPLPVDARLPGPGGPTQRRRIDKAARTRGSERRRARTAIGGLPAPGSGGITPERFRDTTRGGSGYGAMP